MTKIKLIEGFLGLLIQTQDCKSFNQSNLDFLNSLKLKIVVKPFVLFSLLSFLMSCTSNAQKVNDKDAKKIIDACIAAHGGKNYERLNISFDFRKFRVKIKNIGNTFQYERTTKDSLNNSVSDILNNMGFSREINGQKQSLSYSENDKYKEAINSIAYFVLLPYKLNDESVNSQFVGTIKIEDQDYDKIKIWFNKEGGGKDFTDVFCYWINQKTRMIDYLSYTNGGPRFRKVTHREKISGIHVQDFENYEILDKSISPTEYDAAYISGKYKFLSKIEQTNYKVN